MSKKKLALSLAVLVALSGCESYGYLQPSSGNFAEAVPAPRIIPNQPALVSGYLGEKEAWMATGLFSSVEYTASKIPSLKGVYIRTECEDERKYGPFITGLAALLTLGLIPGMWVTDTTSCQTSIFQNGQRLVTDNIVYKRDMVGNGWVVIPMAMNNDKVHAQNQKDRAVLVVRSSLAALSQRNP